MAEDYPPEQSHASEETPNKAPDQPLTKTGAPEVGNTQVAGEASQVSSHSTEAQSQSPKDRQDLLFPGASIGVPDVSSTGSLGMKVTDAQTGRAMLLTAGSVLGLKVGAAVIQPSPVDGGTESDRIGEVARVVQNETCDAGVAWLTGDRELADTLPDGAVIEGIAEPTLGMKVRKYGRTGYAEGALSLMHATVDIAYGDGTRRFTGLFITSPLTQGGDGGAIVLEAETNRAVGLIIANSDQATVCVPISEVIKALDIEVAGVEPAALIEEQAMEALIAANDQVGDRAPDRLGYETYIDIFTRLIREPGTHPPLTIGIYGNWGSGKTFIMTRIMERLQRENRHWWQRPWRFVQFWRRGRATTPNTISVVHFNAWEYEASEDLWAGLVEKIFAAIERDLVWYRHRLINFQRNLKRETVTLRRRVLPYTFIVSVTLATLVAGLVALGLDRAALVISLLGIPGLIRLGVELYGILGTPQSQRIATFFSQPDYRQHLGFMAEIREDLESLASGLPAGFKVVVFVDDLDRCKPEKAVEVLEAIKLMLDFKCFIVFLGIDVRVITKAIEQHYGEALVNAGITGYEYLHKIVQVPFNIPEPSNDDLRTYLNSLMGAPLEEEGVLARVEEAVVEAVAAGAAGDDEQVEQQPDEGTAQPLAESTEMSPPPSDHAVRRETREVPFLRHERDALRTFIPYMTPNPRRVKRLINIYRLVRDLAKARGTNIQNRLEKLIPWLLLNEQWPYTTCLMLELLDNDRDAGKYPYLAGIHHAASQLIRKSGAVAPNSPDADQDLLADLIRDHAGVLTRQDIVEFSGLTINLNPVICSEVIAEHAPEVEETG
jgi:hypothetical protein